MFGNKSPAEIATAAVKGTKLKDLKVDKTGNATGGLRKELLDGGKAKIDASKDPMIELARSFDADARAIRKKYETEVDGPVKKQQELLAQARFAVYGDAIYPDATFTLRLSYGAVKGYEENGAQVKPFTTIAGAFERAHRRASRSRCPRPGSAAKAKLDLDVPFNFVTTNDIIGGNSGSPMVNQKGEVVGLVFDGNIQSLGGDYGFDEAVNRTVAVHSVRADRGAGQGVRRHAPGRGDQGHGGGREVRPAVGHPLLPLPRGERVGERACAFPRSAVVEDVPQHLQLKPLRAGRPKVSNPAWISSLAAVLSASTWVSSPSASPSPTRS